MLTAGGGGHTGYAISIGKELERDNSLVFLVDSRDNLSIQRLRGLGQIEKVTKPRYPTTPVWKFALRFLQCSIQSLFVLLKHSPEIIVSTGSNLAIPIAIIGKAFRSKIINVEDSIRIFSPSKTSRCIEFIAEKTLLQWREQKKFHRKKGHYVGLLLSEVNPSTKNGPILISPGTWGFRELYDVAKKTNLTNVVMTVGALDPKKYAKDTWQVVNYLIGLDEVLSSARVVVTHLGYTLWESINYRVPVVIVPNPAWKRSSVKEIERLCTFLESKGIGIYLRYKDLTPESFEKAIHNVETINLPQIEVGAKKAARLIRDIRK